MKVDLFAPDKLEKLFNDYIATVFAGVEIGPQQVNELKKAFFAGCHTMLQIGLAIGDDAISEDQGVLIMESMHQEVRRFAAGLPDNGKGGPTDEEVAISKEN